MNTALLSLLLVSAAPVELAVFPVMKAESGVDADAVHARVEALASQRAAIQVVSRSEFLTTPRATIRQLGDCAIEPKCLARVARAFAARYLIVVVANTSVDPPLIGTLLIDINEQKLVHRDLGGDPASPLSVRIGQQVDAAFDAAGFVRLARLTVRAEPTDAQIEFTTPSRRDPDGTYWVTPGDVQLDVRRDGFEDTQRALELAPGGEETIDIQLERESSIISSPWLWIAVGVGVAAGVGAAVLVTQSDRQACACVGPVDCPPGC